MKGCWKKLLGRTIGVSVVGLLHAARARAFTVRSRGRFADARGWVEATADQCLTTTRVLVTFALLSLGPPSLAPEALRWPPMLASSWRPVFERPQM